MLHSIRNSHQWPLDNLAGLSTQKKQMISLYVASLHDAFFAQHAGGKEENMLKPASAKLKELITIATTYAKGMGATEQEIQETVLLPSVLCTYKRINEKVA